MEWKSKSLQESYHVIYHTAIEIFLDRSDVEIMTIKQAVSFCRRHRYGLGTKATAVYFLRGTVLKADFTDVVVGILEANQLPPELNEIIHCLTFWNQEGRKCFLMNGVAGEHYHDFILRCIGADCKVFVNPHPDRFLTGGGGRHVWVSDLQTGERILIIHF